PRDGPLVQRHDGDPNRRSRNAYLPHTFRLHLAKPRVTSHSCAREAFSRRELPTPWWQDESGNGRTQELSVNKHIGNLHYNPVPSPAHSVFAGSPCSVPAVTFWRMIRVRRNAYQGSEASADVVTGERAKSLRRAAQRWNC